MLFRFGTDAGISAAMRTGKSLVQVQMTDIGTDHPQVATDAQAKASIYSYSMTKGLFAGVSLEGSVISVSVKRNEDYWKKKLSADDALKRPAKDKRILPLTGALDNLARKAR